MRSARTVALVAGFIFVSLAIFVQGVLPALLPESYQKTVTYAVRTDLGELKWTYYEAEDYTPLERLGRAVYIREGCWYCHSQYVRPVTGETQRWGPVSESGEYAFDVPHLFSTRRIGPDLTRVGLKYADGWHYAHHWDPRLVVPDSNMPKFPWLFHKPIQVPIARNGEQGEILPNDELKAVFNLDSPKEILLTPNAQGLTFAREWDGKPMLHTPNKEFTGNQITIIRPTEEMLGLVAYIQKLGMNRGKWRDKFEPQNIFATRFEIPESDEWIRRGKEVYLQRCAGCHGESGDGNGPAATFLEVRPRIFTSGTFKFRTTPSGTLPTDGDLFRTITMGIRGTPMPTWHELTENDRLTVIQFIKTFSDLFKDPVEIEATTQTLTIPRPPSPSQELIEQGRQAFMDGKCWECHGREGRGDGPSALQLKDEWGFPILPADFTKGIFKSGPKVEDIFRTMSTGLNGTPMPAFADSLTEEQRWAISYFVLSLSAYTDPLHGAPVKLPEGVRQALNSPETKSSSPDKAYPPRAAVEKQ